MHPLQVLRSKTWPFRSFRDSQIYRQSSISEKRRFCLCKTASLCTPRPLALAHQPQKQSLRISSKMHRCAPVTRLRDCATLAVSFFSRQSNLQTKFNQRKASLLLAQNRQLVYTAPSRSCPSAPKAVFVHTLQVLRSKTWPFRSFRGSQIYVQSPISEKRRFCLRKTDSLCTPRPLALAHQPQKQSLRISSKMHPCAPVTRLRDCAILAVSLD